MTSAYAAFLRLTDSGQSCHRADRALTLHMLEHHAPRAFASLGGQEALDAALEGLRRVPTRFPKGLAWYELMARVDALYLRWLRDEGVPSPCRGEGQGEGRPSGQGKTGVSQRVRFDRRGLISAIQRMDQRGQHGLAWLLAALAVPLGVEVAVRAPPPTDDVEAHLASLTHDVLISTDYLTRGAEPPAPMLAVLREGARWAVDHRAWDTLGEVVFCLQAARQSVDAAWVDALLGAQKPDGRFEESRCRTGRERAHTTASCLVALAGAAERTGDA